MSEDINLIAPCGMNCGICMAYLRKKNKCNGCRNLNTWNPKTRVNCKIKNCSILSSSNLEFCNECENYPCKLIKNMDRRYKTNYGLSTIENLESIKVIGIENFMISEKSKWKCKICDGVIDVHKGICSECGKSKSSEEEG